MHRRVQREEMEGDASPVCPIEVSDDDEARERCGGNGGSARGRRSDVEATSRNGDGFRALHPAAGRGEEELEEDGERQGGRSRGARRSAKPGRRRLRDARFKDTRVGGAEMEEEELLQNQQKIADSHSVCISCEMLSSL